MSHTHFNTKKSKGHLKFTERELIEQWLKGDKKQAEIARLLGRNKSTISREIKRGTVVQISQGKKVEKYLADFGEVTYLKNRQRSQSKGMQAYSGRFWYKLKKAHHNGVFKGKERTHNIKTFVMSYALKHPKERVPCFKTVYRYIRQNALCIKPHDLPMMYRLKPRKNKHSRPKGRNKKVLGTSISDRASSVLDRSEFGHWEADLVKGKRHKEEPAAITLVERKTRFAIAMKIEDYKSETVLTAFQTLVENSPHQFKTITFDNGSEFAKVSELENDDLSIYFCHAYASWERGSNENFNKLLREFIPKGKSLHHFTSDYISEAAGKINKRIRSILGLMSAQEAYQTELSLME